MLFVLYNSKQVRLAYALKHNSYKEKQVIFLMITDGKKWHYLFVKGLSALFNKIICKYGSEFYSLYCFYSFRNENVLKKQENVCKDHDYCYLEMHDKDNNILKCNSGENT